MRTWNYTYPNLDIACSKVEVRGPLLGRDPPPPPFNSCQRQPPLSDHSVFAFWVVAYERFDYSNFSIVENSFHPDYRRCLLHIALLPSADISNQQSFISIDDPRPRFSDSAFKLAYSMMWRPRASGDVNAYCQWVFEFTLYLQLIQLYLSRSSAKSLIHAFVSSRVDYCNSLLHVWLAKISAIYIAACSEC